MSEPGLSIQRRILDFLVPLEPGHGRSSSEIFDLLAGLPYRDEVPNGRDFRGADFMGGDEFDFSDTDFSFSPNLSYFVHSDLSRAKFDECRDERGNWGGSVLDGASFRRVRFRAPYMAHVRARNVCFDEAKLLNAGFQDADLSGSSFRGANLKGAQFYGANLRGCDFRGANFDQSALRNVEVDGTTDFRGANLVNAYLEDRYDNAGNLFGKGIDLKATKTDSTTRLGEDPSAISIEELRASIRELRKRPEPCAVRIRTIVEAVVQDLRQSYFDGAIDRVIAQLTPEERELYDEVLDDAFRSLL